MALACTADDRLQSRRHAPNRPRRPTRSRPEWLPVLHQRGGDRGHHRERRTATGIRLGRQRDRRGEARGKHTSPHQLIFDLIGEQHWRRGVEERVKLLDDTFACLTWYSFAVHQRRRTRPRASNPDIHGVQCWGCSRIPTDPHCPRVLLSEAKEFPPLEDYAPTVGCHSLVDPTFGPPGGSNGVQ